MGLGSEIFQFAQLEQELWPFSWRGVNRKFGSFCEANFSTFSRLYPFTKVAVTPVPVEQIEKFHCLKLSTTQGLSTGTL